MILLTDEEIDDIVIIPPLNKRSQEDLYFYARKRDKVLLQSQLKKVVEYIDRISYINYGQGKPYEAERCFEEFRWQALLDEIK